jgi:hypothetical protein
MGEEVPFDIPIGLPVPWFMGILPDLDIWLCSPRFC